MNKPEKTYKVIDNGKFVRLTSAELTEKINRDVRASKQESTTQEEGSK